MTRLSDAKKVAAEPNTSSEQRLRPRKLVLRLQMGTSSFVARAFGCRLMLSPPVTSSGGGGRVQNKCLSSGTLGSINSKVARSKAKTR